MSGCSVRCDLAMNIRRGFKGRSVRVSGVPPKEKERQKRWKTYKQIQIIHSAIRRAQKRCCNKLIARENERDDKNRKVSIYRLIRRDCILEGTIFQVGCRVEYQAPDQLVGVLDKEILNTADGGFDSDVLPSARACKKY